jgi:hypothetical protein
MERKDIAYVVNSTPKYFYLLALHFCLLRRYCPKLQWPVYLATEVPNDPIVEQVAKVYNVKILPLNTTDQWFLESRLATAKALPVEIQYIFPIQEDFLLQARPDLEAFIEALAILDIDSSVASIRMMPCPGPPESAPYYKNSHYKVLEGPFLHTYQATLWRRSVYIDFFKTLIEIPENIYSQSIPPNLQGWQRKKYIQVDFNLAENYLGQEIIRKLTENMVLLAYPRAHPRPNAVYLCPWPYRPTAVEKGKVGEWVYEFASREGFPIQK